MGIAFQSLLSWIWLSDGMTTLRIMDGWATFQSLLSWIWLSDGSGSSNHSQGLLMFQSLLSWIWLSDLLVATNAFDEVMFQSLLSWIWLSDVGSRDAVRPGPGRGVSILVVVDLAL